jgi:hypothetical protein
MFGNGTWASYRFLCPAPRRRPWEDLRHWDKDSLRFWRKNKAGLQNLKPREFEEKYKEYELTGIE